VRGTYEKEARGVPGDFTRGKRDSWVYREAAAGREQKEKTKKLFLGGPDLGALRGQKQKRAPGPFGGG